MVSKHGYIRGAFIRDDLIHHKNYMAQILNLSAEVEGFKKNSSLQNACDSCSRYQLQLLRRLLKSGPWFMLDSRQQVHSVHHCATVVDAKGVLCLRTYVAQKKTATEKKRVKCCKYTVSNIQFSILYVKVQNFRSQIQNCKRKFRIFHLKHQLHHQTGFFQSILSSKFRT